MHLLSLFTEPPRDSIRGSQRTGEKETGREGWERGREVERVRAREKEGSGKRAVIQKGHQIAGFFHTGEVLLCGRTTVCGVMWLQNKRNHREEEEASMFHQRRRIEKWKRDCTPQREAPIWKTFLSFFFFYLPSFVIGLLFSFSSRIFFNHHEEQKRNLKSVLRRATTINKLSYTTEQLIKISERKIGTGGQRVLLQRGPRCCATWSKHCSRWTCLPTHCVTPIAQTSSTISPSLPSTARCLTGPTSPVSMVSTHIVHTCCLLSGNNAESGILTRLKVKGGQKSIKLLLIDREVINLSFQRIIPFFFCKVLLAVHSLCTC